MGVILVRNVVLMMVFIALTMVDADSNSGEPNRQIRLSRWTVHIVNQMASQDVLFVHCKSKDNDLGAHNVTYNQEFSWSFRENIWRTTLFWCYFRNKHAHAEFNVFWPEKKHTWLEFHCGWSDCFWNAKDDGIYLRNVPYEFDDYKHDWNTTTLQENYGFFSKELISGHT